MIIIPDLPVIDYRFTLEIRERFERRLDRDFLESNSDDRDDLFTRIRPGFELTHGKKWGLVVQLQFAQSKAWKPGPDTVLEFRDARDAYVRYSAPEGVWTIGRQRAVMGGERLIGAGEWLPVGRSFDAVRFKNKDWDVMAGKIGVSVPKPRDAELAAVVRSWRAGQTMLIWKEDGKSAGSPRIWTLDHSHKLVRGPLDADYDVALQGGRNAGKTHQAWAAHAGIGYRPDARNRFYLEVNGASGGSSEGKSRTFDNLYPTNHKFYGSMDLQGWRNMQEFSIGWQRKLCSTADLSVHQHWFRLQDARDAWYSAGGTANKRVGGVFADPTGASGKDVGSELDVEGTLRVDPRTQVQLGFGIFDPGRFVEKLNGGRADRQRWFFLQVLRRF